MKKFLAQILLVAFSFQSVAYAADINLGRRRLKASFNENEEEFRRKGSSPDDLQASGQAAADLVDNKNLIKSIYTDKNE